MIEAIQVFTSTGTKLIHHPDMIKRLKSEGRITPISLQVAPTSRCNLSCSFCSNTNRNKNEDLGLPSLSQLLNKLKKLGLKTIEWTGGGDPTLYPFINEAIEFADVLKLEQGFITNGILLQSVVKQENIDTLKWVRISMNCLDYVNTVQLPEIKGTLGFSYVWNDKTNEEVLGRLQDCVETFKPKYVRIVPNCQATDEEQKENNTFLSKYVAEMGAPYFYQEKWFNKPLRCWWCYVKPFVLHDGWVYPCSSVVLNTTSDYTFHEKFRWCRIEELVQKYTEPSVPIDVEFCDHCVFQAQNNLIEEIIAPSDNMENFV